jgi:hypothetical protein
MGKHYIISSGGYLLPLPDGGIPRFEIKASAEKVARDLNARRGYEYYRVGEYESGLLGPTWNKKEDK